MNNFVIAIENNLPALQVVIPLLLSPIVALITKPLISWIISLIGSLLCFISSIILFFKFISYGQINYFMGNWPAPWGIEYVIDGASSYMLIIISGMGFFATLYSYNLMKLELSEHSQSQVYGMWLLALGGLLGLVTTGDAFNLFVFLEISSLSSVALVALGAYRDRRALTSAFNYLLIGAVGATFYVIGVGLLYSVTGTLNIADLTERLSEISDNNAVRAGISFIIIGLMVKAAIFPLHIWLPAAYTYAPTAVTVLLTATATKAALYILARILFTLLFNTDDFTYIVLNWILLPAALIAIFFGTVRAIFENDIKKLLAFSSLSQIGYTVVGLSLGTTAGILAAFIHLANHALMKSALFMGVGSIGAAINDKVEFNSLKGIGYTMPITAICITIATLSLLGIPLTVGFISKFFLIKAILLSQNWFVVIMVLLTSFLALGYTWKIIEYIWMLKPEINKRQNEKPLILIPLITLVLFNLLFGVYAYPIIESATVASESISWGNND